MENPPLAADIEKREPQWHVLVRVQVVGTLGTMVFLKGQLTRLQLWLTVEIQRLVNDIQLQKLLSATRIIRSHLSI